MLLEAPSFNSIAIGRIERPGFDNRLVTSDFNFEDGFDAPSFPTQDEAFAAAAQLSAGASPAAAVFAAGSSWSVVPVNMLTLSDKMLSSDRPYDGIGSHREQGIVFSRDDVLGIVDANVVVRNSGAGETSPLS